MEKRDSELTFTYLGKSVKCQILEKARDYQTIVIFVEIEGVKHSGFLIKKGEKIVAKGEIAKAVRDVKIDGVEMAVAPPADSNALLMARITKPFEDVKEELMDVVFRELQARGFI